MLDDILALKRREFLQQSAGLVALAGAGAATRSLALPAGAGLCVLYQPAEPASTGFAALLQAQGAQCEPLAEDVVRQWRQQLRTRRLQGTKLLGLTSYADFFVLRGLAGEERLFPHWEQPESVLTTGPELQQLAVRMLAGLTSPAAAPRSAATGTALFSWIL
ncbi:MAG: hypothetical protein ACO280_07595 [Pseudohongiellaceae bacterium]|jgi:hypothetical protein